MPDNLPAEKKKSLTPVKTGGALARLNSGISKWFRDADKSPETVLEGVEMTQAMAYGDGIMSAAYTLLGSGTRKARSRIQIMEKWNFMSGDPLISTALSLLTTSALGGHQTSGDVVFIEATSEAKKDKRKQRLVEEIRADLSHLFNRVAFTLAYNGAAFGDAYARIYAKKGVGLQDLYVDELVAPPTLLPFERGNKTIAYATCIGTRQMDRLSVLQIARLKMPRKVFVPQVSIAEKSWRMSLLQDDIEKLPVLPSAAGGSFLYEAENAYDNFIASLVGLVGQRVLDSVDESTLGVNLSGATAEQQKLMMDSLRTMLEESKKRAEKAVSENKPLLSRVRHILPFWNEKQVVNFDTGSASASRRTGNITIEDVVFHARILAGTLGVDLSMIGFADQMSGGLGEGGFFRSSASAAERARVIRWSLAEVFNYLTDVHTYFKYGVVFEPRDRPWGINFYGSISALESERQATRANAMNAGSLLVQTMAQGKELGFTKAQMEHFLSKQMLLDEGDAKLLAPVVDAPPRDAGGMGGGGGEFGANPLDPGGGAEDEKPEPSEGE